MIGGPGRLAVRCPPERTCHRAVRGDDIPSDALERQVFIRCGVGETGNSAEFRFSDA